MLRRPGEAVAILGLWLVCVFNLFYLFQPEALLLTSAFKSKQTSFNFGEQPAGSEKKLNTREAMKFKPISQRWRNILNVHTLAITELQQKFPSQNVFVNCLEQESRAVQYGVARCCGFIPVYCECSTFWWSNR